MSNPASNLTGERTKPIPYVNLYAQYRDIRSEIDAAIETVIAESSFVRGVHVDRFEEDFAAVIGASYCVSCGNGTDALYIAMRALGLKNGDEVITTAHSWIATSETITQAGGRVVFCDTGRDTFNIDPKLIEDKISSRTVGIIPVHLYGQPADMKAIMSIARKYNLWVIEDCAQAHLAQYRGRAVGNFGDAATFSFYPSKNLGAMGDAGAITTNDSSLADRMARFARHGGLRKGEHQIEGINSRLDGLQAAILSVKLQYLDRWTRDRRLRAAFYDSALAGAAGLCTPRNFHGYEHVYHVYAVRHDRRDQLAARLSELGIQTQINYPIALPFLPAYQRFSHRPEEFPNAWHNQSRVLSLPLYPELKHEEQERVVQAIIVSCEQLSEHGNDQK
ncbi:MAG: DegT/DnrJ/EryC1/StrS family aminotransferase [Alphaproteobacteria bacterium]|nr:DegT/DnrJ/EryC1/StrS family aminotransferase [Alphaproteobacteria bacterium]